MSVRCRVLASDGAIPLWECPCPECWTLECKAIRASNDGAHPDDQLPVPSYPDWLAQFDLTPS